MSDNAIVAAWNNLSPSIAKIEGKLPYYPDISKKRLNVGFVHNDLSSDNVFVMPDGYRIIDWQRPIIGPKELDFATLLEFLNRDARGFVDQSIVWILYLLRIEWFTECAVHWFPEGQDSYDASINRLINLVGKSS